jgi:hypothetical protein
MLLKKIFKYGVKYGTIMLLSTIFFFVVLPILAALYVYLFVLLPWWVSVPLLIVLPAILLIGGFFTIVEWLLKKIFPEKEVVLTKPQKQFDYNRLRNDIYLNMR